TSNRASGKYDQPPEAGQVRPGVAFQPPEDRPSSLEMLRSAGWRIVYGQPQLSLDTPFGSQLSSVALGAPNSPSNRPSERIQRCSCARRLPKRLNRNRRFGLPVRPGPGPKEILDIFRAEAEQLSNLHRLQTRFLA